MVIAGTSSGVGKTTVATGLMAALRRRGDRVAGAKVGPDFIDPGYHALATGRPPRNLDPWMCGESNIAPLAARAGRDADVLIVEGVMGLFDGAGATAVASTAHVAKLLGAPVVLVVDASSMSSSVAALVHGFASFDPDLAIAGVILNRVGSAHHEDLLRRALVPLGVAVLGALGRDDAFSWRDRHLGLVPVVEHPGAVQQSLDRLAAAVAAGVDLDAVMRVAALAPRRATPAPPCAAAAPGGGCRIAVAAGPAFSFSYTDNLELLADAGAEIVPFDPLRDRALPDGIGALVAGGGFPEVFAGALADNRPLLADTRRRVAAGLVTWAECGGLLWLGQELDGHRLCGVIAARGRMTDRLTLGYRTAAFQTATPLGPEGLVVRGHEFHYSSIDPAGEALSLSGTDGASARSGWASATLLASYLHIHLAGAPSLATALVTAVSQPGGTRPK
ncbi:MAG: cobyrinic acid a,c-diamide synthase [Acidimicrobiaceae bacterium]|nr:cobyrinic acid a,c-diamide synthase [Acidimicrobiaceae bacterium]